MVQTPRLLLRDGRALDSLYGKGVVRRRVTARTAAGPARSEGRYHIRRYRPADLVAVRRLWRASGLVISPSDSRAELTRSLRRDPDLFLVAEDDNGRIVGVVLGRFDGRRGWVNHLAVDVRARSAGIGTSLMEALEQRLLRKGCRKVNLHIESSNRGVRSFYQKLGYEARPLLFMQKWLPSKRPRRAVPRRGGRSRPG